ncbi:MAG: YggS family pyridoxal phosphate-dependent enzyme [Bacilli bacterium]|nr:YggS family pyridoxal phosphate-dependent enzyme [Bacilli bacterium]
MNQQHVQNIIASVKGARIVAASKYIDAQGILQLHEYGINYFGENRVDAFLPKYAALKEHKDIHWHFIGHLQSNKAKMIADKIECLHSLDSLKLARILDESRDTPLDCFVELHLTDNEAKSGVKPEDLPTFLEGLKNYPKIHVVGFMAMSDADMDDEQKKGVFLKAKALADQYGYHEISMGMSEDYLLAIEAGATTVRLGRILLQ